MSVRQDPENEGTAAQADHIEICNLLKEKIKEKLQTKSEELSTGEIYDLVRASRDTLWLETNARSFDKLSERSMWEQS